ncbi:MAG: hypothetical protein EOO09_01235 [Chitinophagaceae bacterium]|nr:MAG: hypothetical protein EOO09_01235 [Chitinophagaceae bacterium]
MKFRRLVLLLIFLVVVAAWYTKPTREEFVQFYTSQASLPGPPSIEFTDRFVYSSVTVNFYTPARVEPGEPLKAVSAKKEEYLGLFGRFWKL